MKEFNEVSDWDKMLAVLGVMLTIAILFVAVITTKFVYEGGGIWPAVGWVIGWIACFIFCSKKPLKVIAKIFGYHR